MSSYSLARQINSDDQGVGNSSGADSLDQSNDPYSSSFSDQIGANTPYQVGFGSPALWGWEARFAPSAAYDAGQAASAALGVTPASSETLGSPTSDSSQVVSTAGSGLVFDNTYTSSCTAAYEACIVAAEDQLENLVTTSDTIVVTFNEASTAPTTSNPNPNALGNSSHGIFVGYATLKAALLKVAPSDILPSTDPSGGANWYVPYAYARMLGLSTSTGSPDLSVTLNTYYSWDFGQDVINGLTHELSEGGLGRIGGLGGPRTPTSDTWSVMDLFRYNASGAPDYSNGRDGDTTYFSNNGGSTLSNQNDPAKGAPTLSYNNQYNSSGTQANGGDTADWTQTRVFGATGGGETLTLTQTELDVLEVLGWNVSLKQDVFDEALGGWETATNWSSGSMPITPQDAYIGGVDGAMIVTLNSNVTINSIATSADAEFAIGNGTPCTLIADDGTVLNSEDSSSVASGNLGEFGVEPGSALQIGNTFDNAGTLAIGKGAGGSGDSATLYLNDTLGAVTLDGGGTLDLGQAADASQSEIQTEGLIRNAPGTSGDGLANVDDTITGGGLIDLGSFDNQASGKVDASQSGGFWLEISAATFTNEGFLTAESGATLDLGGYGETETLTNTGNGTTSGAINIDAGARLAISGNFTVAGSGDLAFKGAGADVTSDGAGATTFTNQSTILLEASLSSSGAFSGQIGDAGLLGVNDLTYVNDGTTGVDGSGYALTINTGGNTVTNGSNGVLEAEGGATLTIASDLTNQGTIQTGTSSSSGTVDLGADGAAESLNNTGVIGIYASSDLAIRGDYTVSGDGDIGFKGAGAEITSDGAAAATFTNESAIEVGFSGKIGDVGVHPSSDLTFDNFGTVAASGSGVTLTLNTGGHAISDGGTIEAESGATIVIDSSVDTGEVSLTLPPAPGGTLEAGSGGTVLLKAAVARGLPVIDSVSGQVVVAGGVFEMLAGSSVSVPIEFTAGGTLELFSIATAPNVSGSNGTIDLTSSKVSVSGGGEKIVIEAGAGSVANLSNTAGSPDTVTGANGTVNLTSASIKLSGSSDTVTAGAGDIVSLTSGTGDTVTGAGFTVAASSGTGVWVGGNTASGTLDSVNASSATVRVLVNSNVKLTGSSDTVTMFAGTASHLSVSGSTDAITPASGDIVSLTSGTGDTVTGTGFTVDASSGTGARIGGNTMTGTLDSVNASSATISVLVNSNVKLTGSSDTVTMFAGAASRLSVAGSTNAISAASGDTVALTSGTADTVTGTGVTVDASGGTSVWVGGNTMTGTLDSVNASSATVRILVNSNVKLTGSSDMVWMFAGAASRLSVAGSTDAISAASGDTVALTSGTADTITGTDATIDDGSATGLTIKGTADVVYAGLNDSLTDDGASTVFKINANVGALKISNFGGDPTGIIDLLSGVGGYTTPTAAFDALTSDGSGGSLLSLGADGSIDLKGVAPASLHVSNFKIN